MINTPSDAVPWVMRELGYEWIQPTRGKFLVRTGAWHANSFPIYSEDQALAHCLDLNVLSEVWEGINIDCIVLDISPPCVNVLLEGIEQYPAEGKTIQEAALIATGRALEVK